MPYRTSTIAFAERVKDLLRRSAGEPHSTLLSQAVTELESSLEELKVTEEELSRQKEALKESHRMIDTERLRYQELFDMAPDAYVITDADGVIAAANRAAAELFQEEPTNLIGRPLIAFVSEMEQALFRTCLSEFQNGERRSLLAWQTRVQPRGAGPVFVSVACNRTHDPTEAATSLRWLFHDMTRATRADQRRRASEDCFRLMFQPHPLPMWVFDLETLRFLEINDAAVRHYGYSREEFLALTMSDLHPSEDLDRLMATLAAARQGLVYREAFVHRKKDGTLIDVEITTQETTLYYRLACLALAVDISEHKRAENAVRESEARLKFAIEAADFGTLELDFETGTMWRSLRHGAIFGGESPAADWSYARFLEHVHPDDRETVDQGFRHALAADDRWNFTCRIIRTDQSIRCIWTQGGVHRGTHGNPTRLLGLIRDITERRHAETERETLLMQLQEERLRLKAFQEQLKAKISELETLHDVVVGRELKMIALERENESLKVRLKQCEERG